jgi:hypothetical protein
MFDVVHADMQHARLTALLSCALAVALAVFGAGAATGATARAISSRDIAIVVAGSLLSVSRKTYRADAILFG